MFKAVGAGSTRVLRCLVVEGRARRHVWLACTVVEFEDAEEMRSEKYLGASSCRILGPVKDDGFYPERWF